MPFIPAEARATCLDLLGNGAGTDDTGEQWSVCGLAHMSWISKRRSVRGEGHAAVHNTTATQNNGIWGFTLHAEMVGEEDALRKH